MGLRAPSAALRIICVLSALLLSCLAAAPLPAPLSIEPTQDWDGIDGSWNTFMLRVGTPEQTTRAFISTASQQTWVVFPEACMVNATDATDAQDPSKQVKQYDAACGESRGRTFNVNASSSWDEIGFFQLWLEKNLHLGGNGKYGYDTVGLGYTSSNGPTLKNTTVGALVTDNFWLGHFGLNPKPTNFSAFSDPSPSYLTYLFDGKQIPALAWGYTAGAQYRFDSVLGSLTLGGYDASRFEPNDLTFGFAPDNERDIVVGVVGIHASSETKTDVNLLARDQFTMFIDSTIAELYLPVEVCTAFEKAFGLKYDNDTQLYLVDDVLHETLLADNASITFSLGQKFSTNSTVDITLPYAAFDQTAKPPYRSLENATRYFPIRRAEKENQWVLGRTFLQEAYLIVDWERQNFSVSRTKWQYGEAPSIISILSPKYTGELNRTRLSTGAIIGIAIGGGFSFAMIVIIIGWWCWRRRQNRKHEKVKAAYAAQTATSKQPHIDKNDESPTSPINEEEGTHVFPKAELPAESARPDAKDGDGNWLGSPITPAEVANNERQIFEMPGDIPAREADGRQLSEKETMMVRERIYNGVDPTGPPPVSPASEEPPRRLAPISLAQVALINGRLSTNVSPVATVSPTSPMAPRDGSSLEANDTFFQPPSARTPRDGRYLEIEDTLLSPISPLEDTSRRRFSYES